MIAVTDLSVRVGAFSLDRVAFTIPSGAYAVLMGRTGCGKSTVLEVLAGLRPVQGGRIQLAGRDVTDLAPAERGVGYVPQDLALFPTLTVRHHLGFALTVRKWPADDITSRVEELAAVLGIEHLLDRYPRGLSGGEAQRVALGRALSFRPPTLLLDEPLSALDEDTRGEMIDLLGAVQRQTAVTTLHVTHSRSEARALANVLFRFEGQGISLDPEFSAVAYPAGGITGRPRV